MEWGADLVRSSRSSQVGTAGTMAPVELGAGSPKPAINPGFVLGVVRTRLEAKA
jgi:hypothetical protein